MDNFDRVLPDVRFTPYAWQKTLYMLYKGDSEVGGFGISDEEDDSLIVDFQLVKQTCTAASVNVEGKDFEEYLNMMIDQGFSPNKCFRWWIHTHPVMSAKPSGVDEDQFAEFMKSYPWIGMIIISKTLDTYCRVGFNQGPGGTVEKTIGVDWTCPCEDANFDEWASEYENCVDIEKVVYKTPAQYQNKFRDNYEFIDWKDNTDIRSRWSKSQNLNYTNVDDDFDLDDDEMDQCLREYLGEKSIKDMTDEEFEAFSEME